MDIQRKTRAGRVRAFALVAAAALALGGCETISVGKAAPIDGFIAGLDATKTDGAALFASLKAVAPACAEAANAAGFDKTQAHLATLLTKAAVPNNALAARSTTSLKGSFADFREAAKSAGARCLPARQVDNYVKSFDRTLDRLRTTETNKQGG